MMVITKTDKVAVPVNYDKPGQVMSVYYKDRSELACSMDLAMNQA